MKAKAKTEPFDLIIIGGGAAGLSAAVSYGRNCPGKRFAILETGTIAGKKLAITGNGRCNLSNLKAEGYAVTRSFFESLGILLDADEAGRVYPMHRQAAAVRNTLMAAAERLGGVFLTGFRAMDLLPGEDGFCVKSQDEREALGQKILLATGGKAGPQYGCQGDGIGIARRLGHRIVPILPSLTPLIYTEEERKRLSPLKGARSRGIVKLLTPAGVEAEAQGEIQFTGEGISGICVFDLSRTLASVKREAPDTSFRVQIDLAPDSTEDEVQLLLQRAEAAGITGILNSRFAALPVFGQRDGQATFSNTGDSDRFMEDCRRMAAGIKSFEVRISGTGGWKASQTTSGGVALDEVNPLTLESQRIPGLFFAGEILDYDGFSGGWNLDFAFRTGIRAGEGIANA